MRDRIIVFGLLPLVFVGLLLGFIVWPIWAGLLYAKEEIIAPAIENLE